MGHFEASLVLMAYNQEKFVRESVSAALSQEGPPIEIVLSDDASTDNTFAIMQELSRAYTGRHVVKLNRNSENLGIVAHYAKAVAMTSGRWIVQADGDDISAPNRVSRLMDEVRMHPDAAAVVSWFQVLHEDGTVEPSSLKHHRKMQAMQHWHMQDLLSSARRGHGNFIVLGAAAAWRRDVFDDFPGFSNDKDLYEDSILRWRALLLGRTYMIDDILVSYRRHIGSITNWGGLVDKSEAQSRRQRILFRSRKCWQFVREDFKYAESRGLISRICLERALVEIDRNIAYLEALIEWPLATSFRRLSFIARYWRFGIWRQVVSGLLT